MSVHLPVTSSRRLFALAGAILVFAAGTLLYLASGPITEDRQLTTHLTIYVADKIAEEGGLVTVTGIPIPRESWTQLPTTNQMAMWDPMNGKANHVQPGERHFGLLVTAPASVVEFLYPEDGTYTFNFLRVPESRSKPLDTAAVLIGSGSRMTDPEGGPPMDWPSINVIAIRGDLRGDGWARSIDGEFLYLTGSPTENALYYRVNRFEGGRIIELTELGLAKVEERLAKIEEGIRNE
jgi:hypothetical protein